MSSYNAKTVVIADYDYGDVAVERDIIEGAGLELTAAQCKTEDEVIDVARDADAIIAQYVTVGAKATAALTRCQVIARYGTGTGIVDVDAATRRGILVTNVPSDWCENEVADHAMALLLAVGRKICAYDQACRTGTWQWQTGYPIHRLRGSVLEEPAKQRDWKPANPLFTLPNIVVTPHAAYYSEEATRTVRDFAAREVVRVLTGQPPVSPVNADRLRA